MGPEFELEVSLWVTGRIIMVGHSMGGLVARATCATAEERGHTWLTALNDVVSLGTPYLGSWLEKAANVEGRVLRQVSERTAPISGGLGTASP